MKDYSEHKKIMRSIGLPMLIIGIALTAVGFISFVSTMGSNSFERSMTYMLMFGGGGFLLVIGLAIFGASVTKPVSKYYATEMSPAMKITGQSIAEGIKDSGIVSSQGPKEIIKIKCPHCGYLESEDADFCSKCGKKI